MTPERLRQVEELYHAAREDRAVLDQADPELRREVESLLEQEGASLPRLSVPEDSTVTQMPVGQQLGPYKIEARIGAGGMGEVYRAVDTRLDPRMAMTGSRSIRSASRITPRLMQPCDGRPSLTCAPRFEPGATQRAEGNAEVA